ncbi:hypothetical protein OS493_038211 [Desmophyllum pertusum]|uniref:Uncharacterized protein n=1 Tax=Desmophyllum pertusum TaxID=174260 RepID=A0A9W9Z6L8_9CNID|nr:hypothetical protein OS493_038211 [Desmophyllum pertusum]
MRSADYDAFRDWASSYGAAARQRTVRQETTMARHGTLPEFMYQRQYEISEKPVSIAFDEQGNTADVATENESEEDEATDRTSLTKAVMKRWLRMVGEIPR